MNCFAWFNIRLERDVSRMTEKINKFKKSQQTIAEDANKQQIVREKVRQSIHDSSSLMTSQTSGSQSVTENTTIIIIIIHFRGHTLCNITFDSRIYMREEMSQHKSLWQDHSGNYFVSISPLEPILLLLPPGVERGEKEKFIDFSEFFLLLIQKNMFSHSHDFPQLPLMENCWLFHN